MMLNFFLNLEAGQKIVYLSARNHPPVKIATCDTVIKDPCWNVGELRVVKSLEPLRRDKIKNTPLPTRWSRVLIFNKLQLLFRVPARQIPVIYAV